MSPSACSRTLLFYLVPCAALAQNDIVRESQVATKEKYIACKFLEEDIKLRRSELSKLEEESKAYAVKFQAADASLAEQVKRHAPSAKAEFESYNRAVEKRNQAAKAFNDRNSTLQRRQTSLNDSVFEYNAKCGVLLVDPEVVKAVEQELRLRSPK